MGGAQILSLVEMRDPRPPHAPAAVLPPSHEGGGGERRSLLGDAPGGGDPSSSSSPAFAAFDGVEGAARGGAAATAGPGPPGGGPGPSPSPSASAVSPAIQAKVDRALLPALCTLTLVNYLDR